MMTPVKDKQDEEAFLPKESEYEDAGRSDARLRKLTTWKGVLRTGFEIVMGVTIILLLLRPQVSKMTRKPLPVPQRMIRKELI